MDKMAILEHLAQASEATAADVASALGVTLAASGVGLLRLVRAGLASRTLDLDRGVFYYTLTPKGRARLDYLSSEPR